MGIWYRTGTVSVTNGSPNVVGVGTLWLTQAAVGDIFNGPDNVEYEIESITDDTHLGVKQKLGTAAYAGTTASAQAYSIIRNFTSTTTASLASQLAALMTKYHVTMDELTEWLSGVGDVTVHNSVGTPFVIHTPTMLAAATGGVLTKSVAGGATVDLTATESANGILVFTGVLTANISVRLPNGTIGKYSVYNNTTGAFTLTLKTVSGAGVVVTQGYRASLLADGVNVVIALSEIALLARVLINGGAAVDYRSGNAALNATVDLITNISYGTFEVYETVNTGHGAAFFLEAGVLTKLSDPGNVYSVAVDTASKINVFPSGTTIRLQNKHGAGDGYQCIVRKIGTGL